MSLLMSFCLVSQVLSPAVNAVPMWELNRALQTNADESFVEKFPAQMAEFKMVKIPAGSVTVQERAVSVKHFFMSETEIPWEVFEIFALRLDQSAEEIEKDPQGKGPLATTRPSRPYAAIFIGFGHHTFPAICMSGFGAEEFCKWLSKKSGKKYRLPTEAEWRWAAQIDTVSKSGEKIDAWTWETADDTTHPIRSKSPNRFGLYNIFGNVSEWVVREPQTPEGKREIGVIGGSWKDKTATLFSTGSAYVREDPRWNDADPQNPKSRWWLANGQFIGLRLVCEN